MYRFLICVLAGAFFAASASASDANSALPPSVVKLMKKFKVNSNDLSVSLVPLQAEGKRIAYNATTPRIPASVEKIVTSAAALELLGPSKVWSTAIVSKTEPVDGVLDGDIYLIGRGDPSLNVERFWLLLDNLKGRGINEIKGNLVVDRSFFNIPPHDPFAFDGDGNRPYNQGADAMLLNMKSLIIKFRPDRSKNVAYLYPEPNLKSIRLPATIPLSKGPCGGWRYTIKPDFSNPYAPKFHGTFPASCGYKDYVYTSLNANQLIEALFTDIWKQLGGKWKGKVVEGVFPVSKAMVQAVEESNSEEAQPENSNSNTDAKPQSESEEQADNSAEKSSDTTESKEVKEDSKENSAKETKDEKAKKIKSETEEKSAEKKEESSKKTEVSAAESKSENARAPVKVIYNQRKQWYTLAISYSTPLSKIVYDMNKYSNNVIARNLFLCLGKTAKGEPKTLEKSRATLSNWAKSKGIDLGQIYVDNGSGLSRQSKLSTKAATQILQSMFMSSKMPEYMASMPIAGVDGTMRKRHVAQSSAHIKTGYISNVRSIAGYVLAKSGRRYALAAIVNGNSAAGSLPVMDAIIDWVYTHG